MVTDVQDTFLPFFFFLNQNAQEIGSDRKQNAFSWLMGKKIHIRQTDREVYSTLSYEVFFLCLLQGLWSSSISLYIYTK